MASSAGDGPAVTVREATITDSVEVSRMLRRLGLEFPFDPVEAQRYWEWLWMENPSRAHNSNVPPIGWVMESDGLPVGFFGNIPMRYRLKDQTLLVAVASSWGVEPGFRTHTNELAKRYFGQQNVDMFLGTTAGKAVGRIFGRFGMTLMPQQEYDEVFYWVLDSEGFLRAALRRNNAHPLIAVAGAIAGAPAVSAIVHLQRRRLYGPSRSVDAEIISLEAVDSEFDDLWGRKASDGRLYSYRQAADLRWHFNLHAKAGTLVLLRCRNAGLLAGYLIMVREETPSIGLTRAKIVDLFVAEDSPPVIDALISAAAGVAKAQNCHVLEAVGFPASIRAQLKSYNPFTRRFANFPVHFKAQATVQTTLLSEHAWYPTLYDGDSSLYTAYP